MNYLGSKTVGAFAIGLSTIAYPLLLEYLASLVAKHAEIQARLAIYATLSVTLPDPAAMIAQLQAAVAALMAQIESILKGAIPAITFSGINVEADLALILPALGAIQLAKATLDAAFSAGGLHVWSIDTSASALAGEVSAALSGGLPGGGLPGARVLGALILTELPATHSALRVVAAI